MKTIRELAEIVVKFNDYPEDSRFDLIKDFARDEKLDGQDLLNIKDFLDILTDLQLDSSKRGYEKGNTKGYEDGYSRGYIEGAKDFKDRLLSKFPDIFDMDSMEDSSNGKGEL